MMINKRLISTVSESKKYIALNVLFQWISLIANVVVMFSISSLLAGLYERNMTENSLFMTAAVIVTAVLVRCVCTVLASRMSYLSSRTVKRKLREMIYRKLLRLGSSVHESVSSSETVQVCVEGVEQLETYFGQYLPQFFYAMLAPVTLFVILCTVSLPAALVLLVCVPLIPMAIVAVQKWAKKLLAKYWDQYTTLGDTFLENLQGLTTLKIYGSDEMKQKQMNEESENFRKITMKVLTMQLNSITIMDLVAYGGAALGIIVAVLQFSRGNVDIRGCLLIILLSADFFIPMRMLGSFFHIAMNGMAASDKMFRILDIEEPEHRGNPVPEDCSISCTDLHYAYEENREILHGIDLSFPKGSFTAIVGESGCGKSTVAGILMGRNRGYAGSVSVGGTQLKDIDEADLLNRFTYVSFNSYLFKGTVRDNLLMGNSEADDETLWAVLERVNLADFMRSENGLDTKLNEKASNLSGGQCQRLALARALLHDSPVYIFDEATSNIDVESENDIMKEIIALAKTKTVILISHRLANVTGADRIYVMEAGNVKEKGTHEELLKENGLYATMYNSQMAIENYGMKEVQA